MRGQSGYYRQSNFSSGEIGREWEGRATQLAPDLSRGDRRAATGLLTATNVLPIPQGALVKRPVLRALARWQGDEVGDNLVVAKLEFDDRRRYIFVFSGAFCYVVGDAGLLATLDLERRYDRRARFVGLGETLLVVHPHFAPLSIRRGVSDNDWTPRPFVLLSVPVRGLLYSVTAETDEDGALDLGLRGVENRALAKINQRQLDGGLAELEWKNLGVLDVAPSNPPSAENYGWWERHEVGIYTLHLRLQPLASGLQANAVVEILRRRDTARTAILQHRQSFTRTASDIDAAKPEHTSGGINAVGHANTALAIAAFNAAADGLATMTAFDNDRNVRNQGAPATARENLTAAGENIAELIDLLVQNANLYGTQRLPGTPGTPGTPGSRGELPGWASQINSGFSNAGRLGGAGPVVIYGSNSRINAGADSQYHSEYWREFTGSEELWAQARASSASVFLGENVTVSMRGITTSQLDNSGNPVFYVNAQGQSAVFTRAYKINTARSVSWLRRLRGGDFVNLLSVNFSSFLGNTVEIARRLNAFAETQRIPVQGTPSQPGQPGDFIDTTNYRSKIALLSASVADLILLINAIEGTVATLLSLPGGNHHLLSVSETSGLPSWSGAEGWPSTVAVWAGRLVFGATTKQPNRIWFSQANDARIFFKSGVDVAPDDPFERDLGDYSGIRDMQPTPLGLVSFSRDNVWQLPAAAADATAQATTPDLQIGRAGAADIAAAAAGQSTIYSGRNLEALFEIVPTQDHGGLAVQNITQATNPTAARGVVASAIGYPRGYNASRVWIGALADGRMSVLNLDTLGWSFWTLGGDWRFVWAVEAGDDLFAVIERDGERTLAMFTRPPLESDEWLDDDAGVFDCRIESLGISPPYSVIAGDLQLEIDTAADLRAAAGGAAAGRRRSRRRRGSRIRNQTSQCRHRVALAILPLARRANRLAAIFSLARRQPQIRSGGGLLILIKSRNGGL